MNNGIIRTLFWKNRILVPAVISAGGWITPTFSRGGSFFTLNNSTLEATIRPPAANPTPHSILEV
jgi:hypothetical protein